MANRAFRAAAADPTVRILPSASMRALEPRLAEEEPSTRTTGEGERTLLSSQFVRHFCRIQDIKCKCMGCGVAIACSSIATEMVIGKSVEEAYPLTKQNVADALGDIPDYKMICSNLASDAIRSAIDEWKERNL